MMSDVQPNLHAEQPNLHAEQETLSINRITCHYDVNAEPVLENLSLEVNKGEIVCLLGASGCGKTTLLKVIAGLLPISSGEISLNRKPLSNSNMNLAPEQRNIGMIFQDYALFPHLTVAQNIAFGIHHQPKSEQESIVENMLELVHLTGLGDRYPHQLSGGQQQRVAIARSLACQPDLLLLDEPFSNIDTQVRHELIRDIRDIFKQRGVTAIFVTHSREEAFAFADKMAVMHHGVIEQFGSATELYYQPSSKFVANFLGGGSYLKASKISENQFETALGSLFISSERSPKKALEKGQDAEILLRPQHVHFQPDETGTTKIIEQQFMGDNCRYAIEVQGEKIWGQSSLQLNIGQSVSVEMDSEGLFVFANL
ncbi:MAG: ABC transporter ATP-binding protein [Vibrio sp.]